MLLRCIEEDCDIYGVRMNFSKKEASTELNGLYKSTRIRGALERETIEMWIVCLLSWMHLLIKLLAVLRGHQRRMYNLGTQRYSNLP